MRPDDEWLERFAGVTRNHVLKLYPPDSCIASTRIGIAVLRHFGVLCRPQPVTMMAFTGPAFEALAAGQRDASKFDHSKGEHSLGIVGNGEITTHPDGTFGWDGHLVILVPQPAMLIDLSIDQADRPELGLHLTGPVLCPLDNIVAFRAGERTAYEREDGMVLTYRRLLSDNWKKSARTGFPELVVADVIAELE